ncbi:type-F conjugative transfer system pilin assembly thiol-disulfide isomerase TrbB [Vibrio sp. S234-5]|uniref:type-F conjugative transfer system pilin assembly thiol-disulfide isomerase TrbB n=1 Tax=Vibrio sp. S234-5 TaxID=1616781 RepID=UPI0005F03DED|nr:type-F conjugative transfer system pilin assembly thiol-disulfide isomerase TrbB [Vibrio sp. S234-5]KJR35919.1 conjugal transfer protein TrbB [Vibrio sp. S234-5]
MPYLSILLLSFSLFAGSAHAAMQNQYALVFFFQSTCSYCHQASPKVTRLSERFQLPVYAFSVDATGIPGFEVPIPVTPEIGRTFFPENAKAIMPALFLMNVNSRKFSRLSIGDVPESTLAQSIQNALNDPRVQEALQ